ncbi:MAG TPA: helicase-associated domain-containing protein [Gemmataceae bacterium]|nr:helicase-associated domain-containing protein [Gemmataceae bacterium]
MESDRSAWAEAVRAGLARYDEPLLRAVAARLFKPRNQWPPDELAARAVATLSNTPVIDRRLKELPPSPRHLLATVGRSRHSTWTVGQLLALLGALGHSEGLAPILILLDTGLAVPVLTDAVKTLRDWEEWLSASPTTARLIIPPPIADRATRDGLPLPQLRGKKFDAKAVHVADGLEWPLRLGVLWQQLRAAPVRLTQSSALFKRDLTRLQADPLLGAPLADQTVDVPEAGVLVMGMGIAAGLFVAEAGELRAGQFPSAWDRGLVPTIAGLWSALPGIDHWDPLRGYLLTEEGAPFPTVALPALLVLAAQPDDLWTHPADVAEYLLTRHPSWVTVLHGGADDAEDWTEAMFLGWALPLRLVEATQDGEGWWVRLTAVGRHLLADGPAPDLHSPFPQSLVVQPNGDVIVYRQGLTPGLIGRLSRFADWKGLGPACTLGLSAESVYRGLESGLTMADITSVLQQHSAHPVPANVLDLVRRWTGKRERITVHTAATLLEFTCAGDLEAAVARGLVAQKLTDRIGLAAGDVEYRHVRLLGNRDYEARPQQCLKFNPDGVTFTVDVAASDLLLEAELSRLAEPVAADNGERRFRITPTTARAARDRGLTVAELDQWCLDRSGEPLSASARLLFAGGGGVAGEVRRRVVLTLPSELVTDGVCQWPETADLLDDRLGPCTVAVAEADLGALLERLATVGVEVRDDRTAPGPP